MAGFWEWDYSSQNGEFVVVMLSSSSGETRLFWPGVKASWKVQCAVESEMLMLEKLHLGKARAKFPQLYPSTLCAAGMPEV